MRLHGLLKLAAVVLSALLFITGIPVLAADSYDVSYSTYFGGNHFDAVRDVCIDFQGNTVVVGGTASTDFPTTPGAFSRTFTSGGTSLGNNGPMDAYVAKFTPSGQLIWSTYIGGPNYDRAYGVEVDPQGNIYVTGRAGQGFPVTAGSFQPGFVDTTGSNLGAYGKQNGFVAKFSTGGQMLWASYVGSGQLCRDIAVDTDGDVYLPSGWNGIGQGPPTGWFANAFQKTPKGGGSSTAAYGDTCILKIKSDGTQVLWGTWLCGTGSEYMESMLRVDGSKHVYYAGYTTSTDMPTPGNGKKTYGGGASDWYVAKLSPDGSNLIYGTYLGGNGKDYLDTHQLEIDAQGNAYCAILSDSTNWPATSGAFRTTANGGYDIAVCKVGPDGTLLACTYLGGNATDVPEGIAVDAAGNVYIGGQTRSVNFPITANAVQPTYGAASGTGTNSYDGNGFLTVLAADFKSLAYSTFFGKQASITGQNAHGGFHALTLAPDGSLVLGASWFSAGYPVLNAYQPGFNSGPLYMWACDGNLTRFVPTVATVPVASPVFSPNGGSFNASISVTLICATPGATIHFTTDGSTPTTASPVYTAPLAITATTTMRVLAVKTGMPNSTVASAMFTRQTALPSGLRGHWKLDETSGVLAADSSGYGNNGTLQNTSGSGWVPGKLLGAWTTDGLNDVVSVPDSDSLDVGNTLTIAAWINPRSYAYYGRILTKGSAAGSRFDLALTGSGLTLKTSSDSVSAAGLIQMNAWQHVAVTYDGARVRMYVQGIEKFNAAQTLTIVPNTESLFIGNVAALNRPFDGQLDDVRLYSVALTPAEIQTLAGIGVPNQAPIADAGLDIDRLDADEDGVETITLSGGGSSDPDGTIVSYEWRSGGTVVGTGTLCTLNLSIGSHIITLTITDNSGDTASDTVTVQIHADPALRAHWKLDDGRGIFAVDAGEFGNDGELINTADTAWGVGKIGGGLTLDGFNDAIFVANNSALNVGANFTLAAWVQPKSYAYWGRIIAKGSTAGSRYDLSLSSGGVLTFKSSEDATSPAGTVALNAWQHIAVTYDGAVLRMYVQGVLKASFARNLTFNPSTDNLFIGNVAAGNRPLDGTIDDVRVYVRALSAAELQALASK